MKYKGITIRHVPDDPDGLVWHVFSGRYRDLAPAKAAVEFGLKNYYGDPEVMAVRKARRERAKKARAAQLAKQQKSAPPNDVGDGLDGLRDMLRF